MSRVITFSRTFPANHPRKGEPTLFIEKILLSMVDIGHISLSKCVELSKQHQLLPGMKDMYTLRSVDLAHKHHTIRQGKRWKAGDKFSPRYWSGKPYNSKQVEICHDITIENVFDFEVDELGVASINGFYYFPEEDECDLFGYHELAKNDGLTPEDFHNWIIQPCFRKGVQFAGQIICWNPSINY